MMCVCVSEVMRAIIFPQRHLEKRKWFSKFEVIKGWTEAMQLMVGSQILEWWSLLQQQLLQLRLFCQQAPAQNIQKLNYHLCMTLLIERIQSRC